MRHKLNTSLTTVKTIIHIADVHIRLYKRHSEYKEVFQNLYTCIRSRNLANTIIVLAGDIVHAKTDMSPEMVQVTSEFLKTLSDLCPTILIAGNHDLNLANPNRLDALSPIVDNLQHKNLHYLQHSGVYEFADVEFGVHAIVNEPSDWPSGSELTPTKPRIALYHGAVHQAKTDVGYTVTNKITVETFSEYDMVLLGDIHKTQFLQEFGGKGVPEVFYPGSLVQQNHGELLTGHGYGVWDVDTCQVSEYVEVKNPYGYHTIRLVDKKMPDISNLPENLRLRILVGDVDSSLVKKVQSSIRKKYNVVECTVNKLIDKKSSTQTTTKNALDNISDVNHQNALIKAYIEQNLPNVSQDIIQKVLNINTTLNSQIGDDELPKNISWRPLSIKFDNLFSYGEGNSINFDGMNGLYGVFSPNATGKTSAFDAMCFALYDKTPRAFKGSHIMNTRKDSFSCELTIEIGKTKYIIERTGSRKKNGEVKVDVDFCKLVGTTKVSLNGEDRRDTNGIIRSYVGTYEDFILTSLSVQNQNSLFIDTGQTDRKDLLSQFIGLTIFDRLFNMSSDQMKEVVGALKSFKRDDFTQQLADLQSNIENTKQQLDVVQTNINTHESTINHVDTELKILYQKKDPNVPVPIDLNKLTKERTDHEAKKQVLINNLEQSREKIKSIKNEINILQSQLPTKDLDSISVAFNEYIEANSKLQKIQSDISLLELDAANKKEKLDHLKNHKYDPNCKFCVDNVFVKDAINTREQYNIILSKIYALREKLDGAEEYISSRKILADQYLQVSKLQKEINSCTERLNSQKEVQHNISISIEEANVVSTHYELVFNQQEYYRELIEVNKHIQKQIDELEVEKKTCERQLNNDRTLYNTHDKQLMILQTKKDDMIKYIKNAEDLETTYEAYETYTSVIGRDGLPYQLISHVIPTLQTEVNNVLSQMVDFTISLEVDGKNINGKIIYDDNRTWPLELASGMEKFISGLAIRVALMSVSNLPKSNFLVIDEGLGVLDSDNLSSMSVLFGILKGQFEFIILISHLDVVRDIADNLIEIQRKDGFSYITLD